MNLLFNYWVQAIQIIIMYYSIVKTGLICCFLFSFNRLLESADDRCTGIFMWNWILKTRSGAECEYTEWDPTETAKYDLLGWEGSEGYVLENIK